MLINTIETGDQLKAEFKECNRDDYLSGTYQALVDYYEEMENTELDVIAICCDLSEEPYEEVARNYSIEIDYEDCEDEEEKTEALREQVLNHLIEHTMVLFEGTEQVSYWSY